MPNSTTIFFVAFEFPPLGSAGVQRSLKFVKYLPGFNIRPVVITVKEADYAAAMPGHPVDESLSNELSAGTIIERIHCTSVSHKNEGKLKSWARIYFSVIEEFNKTWRPELEKQLPALLEKYKPKAIYVSLPPFAMGPLWTELADKYSLPLIADFRDAWSQWCVAPNASYFHYLKKTGYERRVLQQAARVICSSGQIMKDMQQIHPSINKQKFAVITNGYDETLQWPAELKVTFREKFIIGYVGSFYYTPESRSTIFTPWFKKPLHRMPQYVPRKEDWLYRSPWFFFKAIRRLLDENPALENKIEIRFAGKTPGWLQQQIAHFKLENHCKHLGFLKHDKVLAFQKECDALLITSSKVIGGRDYSIAGKTYEYFTIGRPILGFVCEGEQKDILAESGLSVLFDPDNTNACVATFNKIFEQQVILKPDVKAVEQYHRKHLTSKLAGLIQSI